MRGDGAGKDVDGDLPPLDERIVGDDDGFDFPLREGSFPCKIAPPEPWISSARFHLEMAALHPERSLLIFSRSKPSI